MYHYKQEQLLTSTLLIWLTVKLMQTTYEGGIFMSNQTDSQIQGTSDL